MTQLTKPVASPAVAAGGVSNASPRPTANTTKKLLACGVAAGPLFIIASLVQALTRSGFSLARDAASLLSLGSLGWIQSANFLISGLLIIAGGAGMRRALRGGPGAMWAPVLLYVAGAGMAGAAVFHPDPSGGFPPGTPPGSSAVSSWHGMLHMVCGSSAFLALIAACFVLGRRFAASGQPRLALGSRASGALFAACLAATGAPGGSLTLFVGVAIAMGWVALASARLITGHR